MAEMSAELLARVGCALYGARWQTSLARTLGVIDRTRAAGHQVRMSRGPGSTASSSPLTKRVAELTAL